MPIYEYECPKCGHFEVMQKASDKALKACPDCKDAKCPKAAQRLISASAFHLKGSGWYKTDYSSGASSSSSTKGSTTKTEATKSTEDKPADTKESKSESKGGKKGPCGSGCGCH